MKDSTGREDVVGPALRLAQEAHKGQKRKDSSDPYIIHPLRVAALINVYCGPEAVAAALLHDTLEDTDVTPEQIEAVCGPKVLALVKGLTNPSKEHPGLPRAERKAMDREHLKGQPFAVRYIKLWDRIDNLGEMIGQGPGEFLTLYAHESRLLLKALAGTERHAEEVLGSLIESVIGAE